MLVARSGDKLNRLAETPRGQDKVQVTVLPTDLSPAEAIDSLIADIKNRGLTIDILVNNAGQQRLSVGEALRCTVMSPQYQPKVCGLEFTVIPLYPARR